MTRQRSKESTFPPPGTPVLLFGPLLLLLMLVSPLRSEDGKRTHRDVHTEIFTFKERSPLTRNLQAFCSRLKHLKAPKDYHLSTYRFEVYFPKDSSGTPGLILNIPFQKQKPTAKVAVALNRHNLIYGGLRETDDLDAVTECAWRWISSTTCRNGTRSTRDGSI